MTTRAPEVPACTSDAAALAVSAVDPPSAMLVAVAAPRTGVVKVWMAVQVCTKLSSAMVPVLAGRLAVTDPRAPATVPSVTVPLVALPNAMVPIVPDAPRVGVAVNAGLAPARTWPAAPVIEMFPLAAVIASGRDAVTAGVPLDVPAVHVGVPAVACGTMISDPEVEPRS